MAFTWPSAGHAFACLFRDIVIVSKKVVAALSAVEADAKVIESLTALVDPQAAAVEQLAFGVLGELIAAIKATDLALSLNGINVSFDASVVAEVRKLLADSPEVVSQVEAVFGKGKR